jgi:hypothetical protein
MSAHAPPAQQLACCTHMALSHAAICLLSCADCHCALPLQKSRELPRAQHLIPFPPPHPCTPTPNRLSSSVVQLEWRSRLQVDEATARRLASASGGLPLELALLQGEPLAPQEPGAAAAKGKPPGKAAAAGAAKGEQQAALWRSAACMHACMHGSGLGAIQAGLLATGTHAHLACYMASWCDVASSAGCTCLTAPRPPCLAPPASPQPRQAPEVRCTPGEVHTQG